MKEALIIAGAVAIAILVTVPVALTVYDAGLRPLLDRKLP